MKPHCSLQSQEMSIKSLCIRALQGIKHFFCFRNQVTGALTLRDARVVEHGFKGLVGLSKGRSVRRVPLPTCSGRAQIKAQCLQQVGDDFLFFINRVYICYAASESFLWQILSNALEGCILCNHVNSLSPAEPLCLWKTQFLSFLGIPL